MAEKAVTQNLLKTARIEEVVTLRAQRAERDRPILALREQGLFTNSQIAEMVGTTHHIVTNVIARWRRENEITIHSRPKGTRRS